MRCPFWAQIRTWKIEIGWKPVFWRGGLHICILHRKFRGIKLAKIVQTHGHITTDRYYYWNTHRKQLLPVLGSFEVKNRQNSGNSVFLVQMTFCRLLNQDQIHSDLITVGVKSLTGVHSTCRLQLDTFTSIPGSCGSRERTKNRQNWRFLHLMTHFRAILILSV